MRQRLLHLINREVTVDLNRSDIICHLLQFGLESKPHPEAQIYCQDNEIGGNEDRRDVSLKTASENKILKGTPAFSGNPINNNKA